MKPQSEFSSNVLTLMTGTSIAQAIPIAISPILTRMYTPKEFGLYALFLALLAILASVANARYEQAIMLPSGDEEAINIFALGFMISLGLALFFLAVILIFHGLIVTFLDNKEIGIWLYLLPLSVFLVGMFNLLNYFNNRQKNYKNMSKAMVVRTLSLAVIQVGMGFLKPGVVGLISAQVISQFFANLSLVKSMLSNKLLIKKIKTIEMIRLARKYNSFPKFSVAAVLANTLSMHLINILISSLYSVSTLGFYALVQRVLGLPSSVVGSSIGKVFLKEAMTEKENTHQAIHSFTQSIKKLLLFSIPIFSVLFFSVENIFSFVFGKEWEIAGSYAQILIPLFFIRFISSSLSPILIVFQKQKSELLINVLLLGSSLFLIFSGNEFTVFIYWYSLVMSLNYLLFIGYYYRVAKGSR